MPYARKIGPEEEKTVIAMYAEGKIAEDIAAVLHVNPQTIRNTLRRAGVQMVRGSRPDQKVTDEVIRLHGEGQTLRGIAETLRVSKDCVRQALLREKAYAPGVAATAVVLTEAQLLTIADCFRAGSTSVSISNSLQIPVNAVRIGLKRLGLRRGHRGSPPKVTGDMPDKMVAMYQAGSTVPQVAAAFGVGISTATKHLHRAGLVLRAANTRVGAASPNWKGGRCKSRGYIMVRVYPEDPYYCMGVTRSDGAHYVFEHRLVMARHLGRPLTDSETVHHVNPQDKENNDISNLQLRQGKHGKGGAFQCADCDSHNVVPVPLASPVVH
jgi:transposase